MGTYNGITRRDFIKFGIVTGAAAIVGPAMLGTAYANRHAHPHPGSLDYLDRNTHIKNMEVIGNFQLGDDRGGKMQMMAVGPRRFLFQDGDVIEVSNPRQPRLVKKHAFEGNQLQLAYNKKLGKWILIAAAGAITTSTTQKAPNGKYDDPMMIEAVRARPGLRGIRIYDATDPANIVLLSEFSTDGGDPKRPIQTGSGTHRNYYDGGQYAYLDTAPDDSFIHMESPIRYHANGIMIVDVSDPAQPRQVAMWWVPGQRLGEEAEYKQWREYGDKSSFTSVHGAMIVPKKVEDGGKFGYSAYGSFGMLIHDLSDIKNPRLIGRFLPEYKYTRSTSIAVHTVDAARLDRGIVITNPEALNPDCNEPYVPSWVVDVRDPVKPKAIAQLPVPVPPPNAPYKNFCDKRGRFGTHNPPHVKAPGKPDPNFTCYSYFNAGLQCYDIRDLKSPKIVAYFIPPQGGDLEKFNSFNRTVDNVFVEWDRKLIWVASDTGLYVVATPALGKPILGPLPVREWSLPGLNEGHT
jgi:hypothetical protein